LAFQIQLVASGLLHRIDIEPTDFGTEFCGFTDTFNLMGSAFFLPPSEDRHSCTCAVDDTPFSSAIRKLADDKDGRRRELDNAVAVLL
jgi:hypothetical protein